MGPKTAVNLLLAFFLWVGFSFSSLFGVEINRQGSSLSLEWDYDQDIKITITDENNRKCYEQSFSKEKRSVFLPKVSSSSDLTINVDVAGEAFRYYSSGLVNISPLKKPQNAVVIYQLPIRTWLAKSKQAEKRGQLYQLTGELLSEIKDFGTDYLWVKGVLEAAHDPVIDTDIIKGNAGSYYAIYDSWDVSPQIGSLLEFEKLIKRAHQVGLRIIIDLVPNHTARNHRTDVLCKQEMDFGFQDKLDRFFDGENNYYYIQNETFQPPLQENKPGADGQYDQNPFVSGIQFERPSKVTGNDIVSARPDINDWFETAKLNYGFDLQSRKGFYDPIPKTWRQVEDVAKYWLKKGVDGFRIDFAHSVPIEFWRHFVEEVRKVNKETFLLAEAYESDLRMKLPGFSYQAMYEAGFDSVYNSSIYWALRRQANEPGSGEFFNPANLVFSRDWASELGAQFTHYMENHDEVRVASRHFVLGIENKDQRAELGLSYTAFLSLLPGHVLIHGGQELAEDARIFGSFAGDNGRTSIFDYVHQPQVLSWINGESSPQEIAFRDKYKSLLKLKSQPPFHLANSYVERSFRNLFVTNESKEQNRWVAAFIRFDQNEKYLVVVNSDPFRSHEVVLHFTSRSGEDSHGILRDLGIINDTRRYVFEDVFLRKGWQPKDPAIEGRGLPGWVLYRPNSVPSGLYLGHLPAGSIHVLKVSEL